MPSSALPLQNNRYDVSVVEELKQYSLPFPIVKICSFNDELKGEGGWWVFGTKLLEIHWFKQLDGSIDTKTLSVKEYMSYNNDLLGSYLIGNIKPEYKKI